jgi:hypothetical protein
MDKFLLQMAADTYYRTDDEPVWEQRPEGIDALKALYQKKQKRKAEEKAKKEIMKDPKLTKEEEQWYNTNWDEEGWKAKEPTKTSHPNETKKTTSQWDTLMDIQTSKVGLSGHRNRFITRLEVTNQKENVVEAKALVDSGCTDSSINYDFVS